MFNNTFMIFIGSILKDIGKWILTLIYFILSCIVVIIGLVLAIALGCGLFWLVVNVKFITIIVISLFVLFVLLWCIGVVGGLYQYITEQYRRAKIKGKIK